jgi:hypothetical protein
MSEMGMFRQPSDATPSEVGHWLVRATSGLACVLGRPGPSTLSIHLLDMFRKPESSDKDFKPVG